MHVDLALAAELVEQRGGEPERAFTTPIDAVNRLRRCLLLSHAVQTEFRVLAQLDDAAVAPFAAAHANRRPC